MLKKEQNFEKKLLVVWWDNDTRRKFQDQCEGLTGSFEIEMTNDLTYAFNYAEHNVPDFCFVSSQFFRLPEFEVFSALLDAIGCRCLVERTEVRRHGTAIENACHSLSILNFPDSDIYKNTKFPISNVSLSEDYLTDKFQPSQAAYSGSRAILIGGSTGGIDALLQILKEIPLTAPPIMIVQHTGDGFAGSLIRLLNRESNIRVKAAVDGEPLSHGVAYLSPSTNFHLGIRQRNGVKYCELKSDNHIMGHRPSVDALFHSAAPMARDISASLLTGMGSDGAEGLLALRNGGARTFVQDEESSVVYGMPAAALRIGASVEIINIKAMAQHLLQSCVGEDAPAN